MLLTLAKIIPAEGEGLLLELVGRIEKHRALSDDESRLVEALVRKEKRRADNRVIRVWTRQQKDELERMAKLRGGVKKFAAKHGMPDKVAWAMLRNLRNGIRNRAKVKG